mgnify:CR=1 FL=1
MEKYTFNKDNIFRVEIIDKNQDNNIRNIDKNIKNTTLFKVKKSNQKNKNEIISNNIINIKIGRS